MTARFWTKQKIKLVIGIIGLCFLAAPVYAFLGIGDVVIEPVLEAASQVLNGLTGANLGINTSTLVNAIKIAQIANAEYQRISFAVRGGWINVLEQLPSVDQTVNQVGETLGWPNMMNGTIGIAPTVWKRATVAIDPNPQVWIEEPPGQSKYLARLATAEAIDGEAERCLDQIAQVRNDQQKNALLITNLTNAIMNGSDAFNGTVGQLNINNAALAQGNAERRTQTVLQSCVSEALILNNKVSRDAIATATNDQTAAMIDQRTRSTMWDGQTTFSVPIP